MNIYNIAIAILDFLYCIFLVKLSLFANAFKSEKKHQLLAITIQYFRKQYRKEVLNQYKQISKERKSDNFLVQQSWKSKKCITFQGAIEKSPICILHFGRINIIFVNYRIFGTYVKV